MKQAPSRYWPIASPIPHFMSCAPLDVWFRLLRGPHGAIPPRFLPRLAVALLLSLLATLATLPERFLIALWLRLRRQKQPQPGPVIILGYYRSGTTLLQYLLSCDPNLYSPNLAQVFAPQGFCITWWLLTWFLWPFLPRTRPQDNVALGPLVPAEDDFAHNNWALASTLPGRIVVPQAHGFYDRFHDLKQLEPAERQRWADCFLAFLHKLGLVAGQRRVLLKTPAHTARISPLLDLCQGTTGAKFLYISRHPHKVFRSNFAMLQQLGAICGLQEPLEERELEDYLLKEYIGTEDEYQRMRSLIPAGNLAEVRLQDLQADPVGTIRRLYGELGLDFTPAFEQRLIRYLHANQDFQPNVHKPWTAEQKERICTALEPLVDLGRHDEPVAKAVELPLLEPNTRHHEVRRGLIWGLIAAAWFLVPWFTLTSLVGGHTLGLAWLCGVIVGIAVLRGAANRGSTGLGLYAVALTALVQAAVFGLAPVLLPKAIEWMPFYVGYLCFWWILGLVSAYRIGSQRF